MARLIGVLGGTFDPPHIGHLILADTGQWALGLEKVLWVVTAYPPHKPGVPITTVEDRVEMVKAAIQDNPHFEFSRADIDRPTPHYAIDTMLWLVDRFEDTRFAYLMGSDSLNDLPTWHDPRGFVEACDVIGVMRRPWMDADLYKLEIDIPGLSSKVNFFDAPLIGCSGKDIRRRVKCGEPFRYLVPPAVANLIIHKGLYL